jgi:hypothetical protein
MYIEGKEELSAFSKFITEGRAKQDPDYVPGATDRDHNRTGLRALADAQKKKYSSQDIKSIARKYKQNVADVVGGKTWDWEWIITLMNGLELTYDYGSNTTYIKGWRFDKKKAAIHLAKYGNDHETVRDMQGGGGKVQVTGLETAFEMISEQVKKEGIDIKKASMKDVIKDFQSSDAPQFKGKTDEKKKEMAIAAKLSKEEVEVEESTKEYAKSLEKIANDRALKMLSKSERENLKKIANLLAKEEAEVDEACWKGYKQLGMKKKGNKKVPNCVPEEKEGINEDAPANSVAGGNVNLDPFVKKKRKNAKVETESFGGRKVFVVSPDRFFESRLGKARYARYEKYVGNDKLGEAIRQYGRANPKASIILKNSGNGAMLYLKYGRK